MLMYYYQSGLRKANDTGRDGLTFLLLKKITAVSIPLFAFNLHTIFKAKSKYNMLSPIVLS